METQTQMTMSDLEQQHSYGTGQFLKGKPKTIYSETQTIIDCETGEVKQIKENRVTKESTEPDFIKLYYKTFLAFNDIRDVPVDFIICLSEYMNYINSDEPITITFNKYLKDKIMQKMQYKSISSVDKILKKAVDNGLLIKTEYRATYVVNPFMIAKGSWNNIKKLQAKFDFINNKWIIKADEENPQTLEIIEREISSDEVQNLQK